MQSLRNFRQNILKNKLSLTIFCFFFLATALSAGFFHNHTDDPFHTKEHNDCPVSAWAHTPFSIVSLVEFSSFVLFLVGSVYFAGQAFFKLQFVLTRFSRGPPVAFSYS